MTRIVPGNLMKISELVPVFGFAAEENIVVVTGPINVSIHRQD
jgi:hypothetical protein